MTMAKRAVKNASVEISLEKYGRMLDRIAKLAEENEELKNRRWINVKDRLPGYEMMVIVYSELCGIGFAYLDGDEKWYGDCQDDVQYWMPFPETPEELGL